MADVTSSPACAVEIAGCMVEVTGEPGIAVDKATQFVPFQNWVQAIGTQANEHKAKVSQVHIQSVDYFGPKLGFMKFKADVLVDGKFVPGIVFMRGGAVAILVVLKHADVLYTVMVRQPRVAVGKMNLPEIPAGMLDGNGDFAGVAAKELKEETSISINEHELIDMTHMVYGDTYPGMYPSCGGSDEFNRLFLYRKEVSKEFLDDLQGRLTGVAKEGELINLQVVPLDDLWRHSPDAKALGALCLHDRLIAAGMIEKF